MTQSEYAAIRPRTSSVSISSQSGGSLSAGSLFFWLQARSRDGYNLLSDGAATPSSEGLLVSWLAQEKIVVTFNTGAWLAGEDVFEFVISASATDDQSTAVRLATIRTRDTAVIGTESYLGVGAALTLPLTIELTDDDHVGLSVSVATSASLPSSPIHGQVRYVQDQAAYWVFDELAQSGFAASGSGHWVGHSTGFSQYVADIAQGAILDTQVQGYARPIAQIGSGIQADQVLSSPPYLFDGSLESSDYATKFIISNRDGSSPISSGTRIEVRWYRNGENVSTIFAGLAIATLLGRVDLDTGTLDTTLDGVGSPVVLGASLSGTGGLVTPEDLDVGQGLVYQVRLQADATAISTPESPLVNGDTITFYPKVEGNIGERVALAPMIGQAVSPVGDQMIVLPSTGTAKATMGSGSMLSLNEETRQGHLSPYTAQRDIAGITASTDGQVVAFNTAFNSVQVRASDAELKSYEEKRAEVGTGLGPASGYYSASEWQTVAIAGNTERIDISITHPASIRADYPDEQIRGKTAPLNAPQLTVYARLGGTIYEVLTTSVLGASQQINVTDIGSTTISSVPDSSSDPSFGLFDYDSITPAASTNPSTLGAGSYEIAIAYLYNGSQVTRISHSEDDDCIQVRSELTGASSIDTAQQNTWTAAQRYQPVTLTSALGIVSFDLALGNLYTLTLTENVTGINLENLAAGVDATLEIINPGSYTVSGWDSAIAWAGSTPDVPSDWSVYQFASFNAATLRGTEWGAGGSASTSTIVVDSSGNTVVDGSGNTVISD